MPYFKANGDKHSKLIPLEDLQLNKCDCDMIIFAFCDGFVTQPIYMKVFMDGAKRWDRKIKSRFFSANICHNPRVLT